VVKLALDYPDLSSRELAYKMTDEQQIFLSESSVYRILKARGLITAPAHIFLSAGDEFTNKTGFVHQMWQTDFTYFKILGLGLVLLEYGFGRLQPIHCTLGTLLKHESR
jgi:putative transposase